MKSLSQLIVSVVIAATTVFGDVQISTEAHTFWTVSSSESTGRIWSSRMVKFRGGKTPIIFTNPDLAIGLLTLGIISAHLGLKRK